MFFHSTGADEIDEELEFSEDISISAASEGFTKDESLINDAQFKADYIENLDKWWCVIQIWQLIEKNRNIRTACKDSLSYIRITFSAVPAVTAACMIWRRGWKSPCICARRGQYDTVIFSLLFSQLLKTAQLSTPYFMPIIWLCLNGRDRLIPISPHNLNKSLQSRTLWCG